MGEGQGRKLGITFSPLHLLQPQTIRLPQDAVESQVDIHSKNTSKDESVFQHLSFLFPRGYF